MSKIDAKNKFREGFIMLLRPFVFKNIKEPLQKFTILWAYSEQPLLEEKLTKSANEKITSLDYTTSRLGFFKQSDRETFIQKEVENILNNKNSYENLYQGEIVQCTIEGEICRFYPDEYSIINRDKLTELMQEEGYHVICDEALFDIKDFQDKKHYLQSRGISERIALKWASLSYGSLVHYKPYYQVLEMFCKPIEIIEDDHFYSITEGIDFTKLKKEQSNYLKVIKNNQPYYGRTN